MWLHLQKGTYTCNYKYLEIEFWNIQFIISQECMEQLVCISTLIYSHPRPFSGWTLQWTASWNACHFASLFHKVVNTTSSPIGVKHGGWWGATKWQNLPIQKNSIWSNGIDSGCFQLHISQNVATSMSSLTSQSCGDSLPAVYLARRVGTIYRPPKHPWMPDRPVNEASIKVDHWTFGNGISTNC